MTADGAGMDPMHRRARGEDFSPLAVHLVVDFAAEAVGAEGLDAIAHRTGAPLHTDRWVSYDRFRALLEAVADATGGPAALRLIVMHEQAYATRAYVGGNVAALATAEDLLRQLAVEHHNYSMVGELDAEERGEGHWLVRHRFHDGYAPFPAYCGYLRGVLGRVTRLYGLPPADVDEVACQTDGASTCTFRMRWNAAASSPEPESELQSRVLEARLEALQESVGDLVSGASTDIVLGRVLRSVGRTVLARGYVLAVHAPGRPQRWVGAEGLTENEAARCADSLAAGHVDPRWSVSEVRSGGTLYGHLVAVHATADTQRRERVVLEAHARVAASALDSARLVEAANRQAELATTLLQVSRSLAEIGTTSEMAERLASATPVLVDCDQVVVTMLDAERVARVLAARGFGPDIDPTIVGTVVPLDEEFLHAGTFRILRRGMELTMKQRFMLGSAAALATVPIALAGDVIGWIAVIVQRDAERLLRDPGLDDRLHGLAALAATAMYNARLVDDIRFLADHDPLTGLANQRLLELHTTQAIARARRDREELALLFLDLDDFKDINDDFGHAEGDRVLQTIAARVRAVLRESDTVARVGGDEFAILLPSIKDGGAAALEKVRAAVEQAVVIGERPVHVRTSVGVARYPADGDSFSVLLHRADMRMYDEKLAARQAKRSRT